MVDNELSLATLIESAIADMQDGDAPSAVTLDCLVDTASREEADGALAIARALLRIAGVFRPGSAHLLVRRRERGGGLSFEVHADDVAQTAPRSAFEDAVVERSLAEIDRCGGRFRCDWVDRCARYVLHVSAPVIAPERTAGA